MVPPNGPVLGPLDVDVDPLVVAGRLGERVDAVLGDLQPLGGAEVLAHGVGQLVGRGEGAHAANLPGRTIWPLPDPQRAHRVAVIQVTHFLGGGSR